MNCGTFPTDNSYEKLKTVILERTVKSGRMRRQKLLQKKQLGNLWPTQLLRRMKQLAEGVIQGENFSILKPFLLQRLPTNI